MNPNEQENPEEVLKSIMTSCFAQLPAKRAFALAFTVQNQMENDIQEVLDGIKEMTEKSLQISKDSYIKLSELQLAVAKGCKFDVNSVTDLLFPKNYFPQSYYEDAAKKTVSAVGEQKRPMSVEEFNAEYRGEYNDSANAIKKELPPKKEDARSALYSWMGIPDPEITRSPYDTPKKFQW